MKHIKTFENFELNEEILGFGKDASKKAYQNTINFLEGKSEEAKKVKALLSEIKESGKPEKDPANLKRMQTITALGQQWAKANKMEPKDYAYSQIKTVAEENYDRLFKGGVNLTVAERRSNRF